jgi:hypothetical protein
MSKLTNTNLDHVFYFKYNASELDSVSVFS